MRTTFFTCVALSIASPAMCQVGGAVVTHDGKRLPNAAVELWTPTQRVARLATDADGRFYFSKADLSNATALVVEHLGFAPHVRSIILSDTALRITLEARPLALPELVASAKPICPNKSDARAEAAWHSFAAHYQPLPQSMISTGYYLYTDIVSAENLGRLDERNTTLAIIGKRKGARADLQISRDGYARRATTRLVSGQFDSWEYAQLGNLAAEHFIDEGFKNMHSFSMGETRTDGTFDLIFCPKQKKQPDIEGALSMTRDTLLYEARWRFRVPRNDEFAVGTAVFAPPEPNAARTYLLPVFSTFWRQHRMPGQYYQQRERYGIWAIGDGPEQSKLVADWRKQFDSRR